MIVQQGRLIRARQGSSLVTHHTAPRSGQVHDGHPTFCTERTCREWATTLSESEATERLQKVTAVCESNDRHLITAMLIVMGLTVVGLALALWLFLRTTGAAQPTADPHLEQPSAR